MPLSITNITFKECVEDLAPRDQHTFYELSQRREFFRRAFIMLKCNGITGDYAEFGCYGGATFSLAYEMAHHYFYAFGPMHMWAFDSFQGLPPSQHENDDHPAWIRGEMAMAVADFQNVLRAKAVPPESYTIVPGFYDQTLTPQAPGPRPAKIALAYIDCDMYSSTKCVLDFLLPRLQHGMLLALDDYYCYSQTLPSGERLALAEALRHHPAWQLLPYQPFGWHGMSFIVEARTPTTPPPW